MPRYTVPLNVIIEAPDLGAATIQAVKVQKLLAQSMVKYLISNEGINIQGTTVGQPTPIPTPIAAAVAKR